MNLTEELHKQKEKAIGMIPEETMAIMDRETKNLGQTEILSQTISEGDIAPDFTLTNIHEKNISLHDALNKGPVVLKFFRGDW